ncbi:MAG: site-2 protease family protein [Clostridia bacterium]|nr:site-2 protease family protein [Clostridia bacterium]
MLIGLVNGNYSFLTVLAVLLGFFAALLICMPFHEFAHAFVAYKEGDYTARAMKRYTLAPFAHIDLSGFLLLLFFGIGYAKPVPVDLRNLRRGRKSEVLVAVAGVITNIILGILFALIFGLLSVVWPALFKNYGFLSDLYTAFFTYMVLLNFMLAFFNILPIYPLDGFRVVEAFARPGSGYVQFMKRFGFFVILLLLITPILDFYLNYTGYWLGENLIEWFKQLFKLIFKVNA